MEIHDAGHARFSHANQCETGPKLIFDQALIIEQLATGVLRWSLPNTGRPVPFQKEDPSAMSIELVSANRLPGPE